MSGIFKALALSSAVALLVFASSTSSRSQSAKNTLAGVLRLFPGYHVLDLKECDPAMRSYLLEKYPKVNPGLVHADFDGDGSPDFALLLKNDTRAVTTFVILLCPAAKSCKKVYDIDVSEMSGIVYLRAISAGARVSPMDDVDTNGNVRRVRLRAAAVELNYFEKSSVVLYWNRTHKKIEEIWTSD